MMSFRWHASGEVHAVPLKFLVGISPKAHNLHPAGLDERTVVTYVCICTYINVYMQPHHGSHFLQQVKNCHQHLGLYSLHAQHCITNNILMTRCPSANLKCSLSSDAALCYLCTIAGHNCSGAALSSSLLDCMTIVLLMRWGYCP